MDAQPHRPGERAGGSPGMQKTKRKATARRSKTDDIVIPDRLYFRIGDVAKLLSLPTYVLRFWETEFPQLKPTKGSTGQRMYRKADVECAVTIKRLLYEEGFTIAGARAHLKNGRGKSDSQPALFVVPPKTNRRELLAVRQGLNEILTMLSAKKR
jgi:DNA-binding transcriptional MerR regulator